MKRKITIIIVVLAALAGLAYYFYTQYQLNQEMQHPKFYSGNGRLEATEVYVSSKLAGRIEKIFVKEGDLVKKGDKLVQMQTNTLEAQKASTIATIKVQESSLKMAKATLLLKQSSLAGATKEYEREKQMLNKNATSAKKFDEAETKFNNATAEVRYAEANVSAAEGRIAQAKADLQKIEADISDSVLYARYAGRIEYILAHEGEVISAGGRVLNMVNLMDAYMTFFLPTKIAGRIDVGSEVKLLFDAVPECTFDAKVTFVDAVAQFTPKSVETKIEREKLMFRIKATVGQEHLRKYINSIKTGLPGVAWVKVDPKASWADVPAKLPVSFKAFEVPDQKAAAKKD